MHWMGVLTNDDVTYSDLCLKSVKGKREPCRIDWGKIGDGDWLVQALVNAYGELDGIENRVRIILYFLFIYL